MKCQGFEPRMSETPDLQSSAVAHAARTSGVGGPAHTARTCNPRLRRPVLYPIELTREGKGWWAGDSGNGCRDFAQEAARFRKNSGISCPTFDGFRQSVSPVDVAGRHSESRSWRMRSESNARVGGADHLISNQRPLTTRARILDGWRRRGDSDPCAASLRPPHFQCGPFDRSGTSPKKQAESGPHPPGWRLSDRCRRP